MSKSKNNVVDPISIISSYGADTARWFVLSDSPPERDVEWTASGAEAAFKHLNRVWQLCDKIAGMDEKQSGEGDKDLLRALHKTIEDVTSGVESFGFNAAIAKLYGFTATLAKSKAGYLGAIDGAYDAAFGRGNLGASRWEGAYCSCALAKSRSSAFG